jgi:hypothetical protein
MVTMKSLQLFVNQLITVLRYQKVADFRIDHSIEVLIVGLWRALKGKILLAYRSLGFVNISDSSYCRYAAAYQIKINA